MTLITPARRAQLAAAGRIGGLAKFAKHGDTLDGARKLFRDSFAYGHACKVCPEITIPENAPDRTARADALYRMHLARAKARRRG